MKPLPLFKDVPLDRRLAAIRLLEASLKAEARQVLHLTPPRREDRSAPFQRCA